MPDELDPATYGLTIWDLDREFLTGGVGRRRPDDARRPARRAARRVLPHHRHRVHAHPGHRRAALDPVEGRGRRTSSSTKDAEAPHPRAAQRRRGVREVPRHEVRRHQALRPRGRRESAIPILDEILSLAADAGLDSAVLGMAHRGRLNVLANIMGKSYDQIFKEFEGHVDPSSVQGSGDVKYHLGATRQVRVARPAPTSASSSPPTRATSRRSTRSSMGMVRARQDQIDPPRSYPGAADPDPRRRRVRRPGRRRRVPGDERHQRLPRRRHDPPHHQQPDRVHHGAAVRPLVAVLQRRRQDRAGADLPRQRRRSRGVRARRPAGVRVPPAVPQGRRHRHGAATAATVTTRATTRATRSR